MMKHDSFFKFNRWTAILSLCLAVHTSQDLHAKIWGTTPSFVQVAKTASPAVVSIQVKMDSSGSDSFFENNAYSSEDPFDLFGNSFFRFFGPQGKPRAPKQREQVGQASGFLVSADGYILTNAHVVQEAHSVMTVMPDGQEYAAKIIGMDPHTDVALLKIEGSDFNFLKLGDSDAIEVGEWVAAIGNPLGLQSSVTVGVVSAKGRNNLSLARIEDFIQTDAAINRGNSGGPLLDMDGEVIGMNTAIVTNMGTGGYMGIGFAIPSNIMRQVMEELLESGNVTRGFIGVSLQAVNQDLAQAFGLKRVEGALVADVSKNSPAEKGGIRAGDVILQFNGKRVDNIATLRNGVELSKPGSQATLIILREGKQLSFTLTLGSDPNEKRSAKMDQAGSLGLEFETLTSDAAKKLGYTDLQGVLISGVKAGSPAAWAGLRKGTIILSLNHTPVQTAAELQSVIHKADHSKPLLFLVKQGNATAFISLKIGN